MKKKCSHCGKKQTAYKVSAFGKKGINYCGSCFHYHGIYNWCDLGIVKPKGVK